MDPQEDKELSSETNARGSDNAREGCSPRVHTLPGITAAAAELQPVKETQFRKFMQNQLRAGCSTRSHQSLRIAVLPPPQ